MRASAVFSCAILLIACAKTEQKVADTTATAAPAAAPAPAPAPPPAAALSLVGLAGKWTAQTRPENSDSVLVTSTITATADTTGWTIALPKRPVMPLHVSLSGDSLLYSTGSYESVLRKGVQVSTSGVLHKQGDKLVGINLGHYKVAGADSVRRFRMELTKQP
jgi:glucose/arabinose dehydrogenase